MEVMDSIAGEADHLDRQSEHDEHDRHSEHSDHDQNAADPEGSRFRWVTVADVMHVAFDCNCHTLWSQYTDNLLVQRHNDMMLRHLG